MTTVTDWRPAEERIVVQTPSSSTSLAQLVANRIIESTHGRIRDLTVEEIQGRMVVCGQAPSHHSRQLALQGALELLSGERFSAQITVGPGANGRLR